MGLCKKNWNSSKPVSRVLWYKRIYIPYHLSRIIVTYNLKRPTPYDKTARAALLLLHSRKNRNIHGLTTHKVYGIPYCYRTRWALTPPFHPYPDKSGRLFSVTLLYPHGYLPVRKHGALCCPDFPLPSLTSLRRERWNNLLPCKVNN